MYFNVGGKLIESAYDSTAGEYVAEYVFGSAGLIKVVVSCRDINITDNRGVDITVLKQNAAITAKDASYIINYGGKYSLTLKGSNGKAVAGEKVTFMLRQGYRIGHHKCKRHCNNHTGCKNPENSQSWQKESGHKIGKQQLQCGRKNRKDSNQQGKDKNHR